jgi:hypothetical protein
VEAIVGGPGDYAIISSPKRSPGVVRRVTNGMARRGLR